MLKICQCGWVCACLCLALGLMASQAAETNAITWHRGTDRVDADVRGMPLLPLLEKIAADAGWRIYVEPDTTHSASAKFKDLPSGEALKRLLGDLNFALVPQTNAVPQLYVFRTVMKNATQQVLAPKPVPRHVANELLVKLKPGADADALAKLLGAKITGRNDKLGLYRLQFGDATATDAALGQLQGNSDVAAVDYNYYFDPPPPVQALSSAPVGPLSLTLNPPGDSGKVIVGLIDTPVQSLGAQLDKFILPQQSVAGDATVNNSDPTHGTAMAYTILSAIAQQSSSGGSSAQILPVDVYGGNANTTSWDVALGVQKAVDGGATALNMSLGGPSDSSILDNVLQKVVALGIPVYAAAGNQPLTTPTYPAADPGVISVTALQQQGQIASYANFGLWVDLALPGASVIYFNGQPWGVQGTSVSTAYATGVAAGNRAATGFSWTQIMTSMQQRFPVPKN
jgi:hypothetical protein